MKELQFQNLDDLVEHIIKDMSNETKESILKNGIQGSNMFFGMQLRNTLGLWWHPDNYEKHKKGYKNEDLMPLVSCKNRPTLVEWFHNNGLYSGDDMTSAITVDRINEHWKKQGITDSKKEFAPYLI